MKRVLSSVVAIPIVILIIQWAPVYVCIGVILIAMMLALHEYFALVDVPLEFRIMGFVIAAAALLAAMYARLEILFLSGVMLMLMVALFSRRELTEALRATVFAFFGAVYVGLLMSYLVALRLWQEGAEVNGDLLMMLLIIIWSGDSFAYFAGRKIGRHKLAPVISPNKTWEGSIAGFLFSIVAAIACRYTFVSQLSLRDAIGVGAAVGILGQIGDLCESIVKRAAKVKDSGGIIPGHGGMLDRVDSLLFGAPAMYYYLSFFRS
jgi:phosphatidate cytidylyltransferase